MPKAGQKQTPKHAKQKGQAGQSEPLEDDLQDDLQATPAPPRVYTSGMTPEQQDHADRIRSRREQPQLQPKNWTHDQWIKWHKAHNGAQWSKLHQGGDEAYPVSMRQAFWDFRKAYVDGLIEKARKKWPTLLAKSVGSRDITSDYDLTISTPGSDGDIKAMRWFNAKVAADFGKQPGTVFDTNLYAKDYLGVEENLNAKVAQGTQGNDKGIDQPSARLATSDSLDQEVASLVKIRRYMSPVAYQEHMNAVVEGIEDVSERKATIHQYEEADAIYQIGVARLLRACQAPGGPTVDDAPEDAVYILQKALHDYETDSADELLRHSNELYYKSMKKVRGIQALLRAERAKQPPNAVIVDSLSAQAKKAQSDAIFFAAEAYHSEGAVKHIVAGLQGDDAGAALAGLTGGEFLQSLNEQFGDFLKDCAHYADAPAGKLFYRSSKYLYRMFDAAYQLRTRIQNEDACPWEVEHNQRFDAVASFVKGSLVALRKGSVEDETERQRLAVDHVSDALGTKSPEAYQGIVTSMVQQMNALARTTVVSAKQSEDEVSTYHSAG